MHTSRRNLFKGSLIAAGAGLASCITARSTAADVASLPKQSYTNIVVGSGYGAAVAAYRLTKKGHRVLLLEMGQRWNQPSSDGKIFPSMLTPDERSVWLGHSTSQPVKTIEGISLDQSVPYGAGILDFKSLGQMSVYRGIGYGGGSLVNGGISPRPSRNVLSNVLPQIADNNFFRYYLPLAERRLNLNSINPNFFEETEWYQFSRTARDSAKRAGYDIANMPNFYDFSYMEREAAGTVPKSALANELIYGNNYGRKSLTHTYLSRAEQTGLLTVQTLTEVISINALATGGFELFCIERNKSGMTIGNMTFRAKKIFLGAGSVGTTEILLRSQENGGLTRLSPEVGKGWGTNGNITFGRTNPNNLPTGSNQSTIAVTGIDCRLSLGTYNEVAPLPLGFENYISYYLSIAETSERCEIKLVDGQPQVTWKVSQADEAIAKVRQTFDRINDMEGTSYRTDLFGYEGKIFTNDWTYHPLGGAVFGKATNDKGGLKGHEGLVVVDGALLPGSIGVNPLLTITALAERIMDSNL
ncbi:MULTISPECIES: GMC oxidoreductase [Rothia]|uniref:GMC oxidoreductase n=1 Tax=Rothia TaxID=32207 RepID=UPI0009F44C31|nr:MULTISPECIES: GMC oxidoreductase [Rothia]